jgi:predicted nucleotidyltransferase
MPSKSFGSVKIFSPHYSREEVVQLLKERLPELAKALPLRRVVLFGSYARGNFTAFSDIDLLVVYADPPRGDAFGLVKKTLNLFGLQPHVLSESEFTAMRTIWQKMIQGGLDLFP